MDDSALLRFALISGLIGFAVFCASYTLEVWRRRNAQRSRRETGFAARLRYGALLVVAGGMAIVAIAVAIRELDQPEGRLVSDDLFGVRAPADDLRLVSVFQGRTVKRGEILARLESPFAEAQVRQLECRLQRLEQQRETLQLKPLEPDPELVRQQQNLTASRHNLRASLEQLLPAHAGVVREFTLQRLNRLEKSIQLDVLISTCLGESEDANIRHDYVSRQLARFQGLAASSAITHSELESWQTQLAQVQAELANQKRKLDKLQSEKAQLDKSLQELAALEEQQETTVRTELDRVREDLSSVQTQHRQACDDLADDLSRARLFRDGQLVQNRLEVQECRASLEGAQKTLLIRAPFDGSVVFRDLSPQSAGERQPVLAVSRQAGCRMQVRLPSSQAAALQQAQEVILELSEPAVEPYFSGRFLAAAVLQHKPRYALAELTCQPPPETVRDLVAGEEVRTRLRWRPPLLTLTLFRTGIAIAVLGAAVWLATGWWLHPRRVPQQQSRQRVTAAAVSSLAANAQPTAVPEFAAPAATGRAACLARLEAGTVAGLHELLGARLRESLLCRELDEELITALEWALDRHHVRAVRQLRTGLQWDEELAESVGRLLQQFQGHPPGGNGKGSSMTGGENLDRMIRVLKSVAPNMPQHHVCC